MNSMLRRLALAAACTIGAGAVYALAEGGGDLVVFDWSGYEDPLLHPAYAAKYGNGSGTRAITSDAARQTTMRIDPR